MKSAVFLLSAALTAASPSSRPTDEALYKAHDWFSLRERADAGLVKDPLLLGATEAAFDNEAGAHAHLDPLLSGPNAPDAHTWLSYIDMRHGRYRAAAKHIQAAEPEADNALAATFSSIPDQITIATAPARLRYRIFERKMFVPALINGKPQQFILDSDANLSFLSATAAKRLSLTVRQSSATTAGALGASSALSIATADVTVGRTHIRNVAFMVLPDSASLFATLRPDEQGALGLSVLQALRSVSWDRDGSFRTSIPYNPHRPSSPLAFDGADPLVRFSFNSAALTGVLDTGAETTNLWPPFAKKYAGFLNFNGTAAMKQVRGFGGDGQVPEVIIPTMQLKLGGSLVTAAPAHVLKGATTDNSNWLDGRLGLDLFQGKRRVTIDFQSKRLQVAE